MTGAQKFAVMVSLLIANLILTIVLMLLGYDTLAMLTGTMGTWVIVFGMFLWVAIFDSRKRWPGQPFGIRVYNMLTFKSD